LGSDDLKHTVMRSCHDFVNLQNGLDKVALSSEGAHQLLIATSAAAFFLDQLARKTKRGCKSKSVKQKMSESQLIYH